MPRDILERPSPPGSQRISYGPHPRQFGDLRLPDTEPPFPLAISIHGGFWRPVYGLEHMSHLCESLCRRGFATWNIEYRRMTENESDWRITTGDALRATRFARELPIPIDWTRVILLGFSAGGQLALWTAARDLGFPLRAVISLAGAVDLRTGAELGIGNGVVAEFLGTSVNYPESSPIDQIPIPTPVRLIHGTSDDVVPYSISQAYLAKAQSAGMHCSLLTLPGGDHFSVMDPTTNHWPSVLDFLLG